MTTKRIIVASILIVIALAAIYAALSWSLNQILFSYLGQYNVSEFKEIKNRDLKTVSLDGDFYVILQYTLTNKGFIGVEGLVVEVKYYFESAGYGESLNGRLFASGRSDPIDLAPGQRIEDFEVRVEFDPDLREYFIYFESIVKCEWNLSYKVFGVEVPTYTSISTFWWGGIRSLPIGYTVQAPKV